MIEKKSSPKRFKKLVFKLIIVLFGLSIAGAGTMFSMVSVIYPKLPSMEELYHYQPKLPLQVYSSDGIILGQFGQEHRIFISFDNTPKMLIKAILAAEDERFYKHNGIDYIGVMRAAVNNLISGHIQSGASTITMQVARNFFLNSKKTFSRKFNEALLAYKIEKSLSKDQILELYINQIYLGQRSYGFAEASFTYFGKPLDKLNIAEYSILAGLPKAPSAYNPVVNKQRARSRQLYVLGRMKSLDFITQKEYDNALVQKIIVIKGGLKDSTDSGGYIAEMVRQMLFAKFGESIYTQGYKVITTVDSKMQQAAYIALRNGLLQYDSTHGYQGAEDHLDISDSTSNDALTDQLILSALNNTIDYGDLRAAVVLEVKNNFVKVRLKNGDFIDFSGPQLNFIKKFLTDKGKANIKRGSIIRVHKVNNTWAITQIPEVEGALIALDPNNGQIKALVGGFDFTDNNFNHVTQAMRQPGSSFKPFIYSAGVEKGIMPNTIIDDSPICYPGGANGMQWCPKNDEEDFIGPITLREALAKSRNVVTIKLLDQIKPAYAINYVTKFGFDAKQFHPYLTMALGAVEATPMQMAQAYAVFANGGYLVTPYLIQTIQDNKGNVLAKTESITLSKNPPAIDPRNAFILNSMLQDVARYGTGARSYRELKRNDLAGKTGTTSDNKDVWFDGYTPDLVTITWIGYDSPKSLGEHAFGASLALPIWINFMHTALENIPERQLPMPQGIRVSTGTTWKGQNEYFLDGLSMPEGRIKENSDNLINVDSDKNKLLPIVQASAPEKAKDKNIEDLIKKIQN